MDPLGRLHEDDDIFLGPMMIPHPPEQQQQQEEHAAAAAAAAAAAPPVHRRGADAAADMAAQLFRRHHYHHHDFHRLLHHRQEQQRERRERERREQERARGELVYSHHNRPSSPSHLAAHLQSFRPHLQKLSLSTCRLGDAGVETLVQALVQQSRDPNSGTSLLREMDLNTNRISPRGLVTLSQLFSSADIVPHLTKLVLDYNPHLLDDGPSTLIFCRRIMLISKLKILHVQKCSDKADGLVVLCESLGGINITDEEESSNTTTTNGTAAAAAAAAAGQAPSPSSSPLTELDISFPNVDRMQRPIAHALATSLPRIQNLTKLICGTRIIRHSDRAMTAALHKNTSILQLVTPQDDETKRRCVDPVLQRNRDLRFVDAMLNVNRNNNNRNNNTVPVALWSHVLGKAGQASLGATAIFKVVRDRPATFTTN